MKRNRPLHLTLAFLTVVFTLLGYEQSVKSWQVANQSQTQEKNKRSIVVEKEAPPKSSKESNPNKSLPAAAPEPSPAAADGVGAQSYALIIGVSNYQYLPTGAQLKYADKDAKAIRDFLISKSGGFRPENVKLLTNAEASWQQIFRELESLQSRCGPDSLAFIFFAGHGIVNKAKQGFLLAFDSQPNDILVTSIEMNRFNSVVQNIRARSTVIFSDACHSGTIGDLAGQQGNAEKLANVSASAFADPSGRGDQSSFIFSAASPTQSSWEMDELGHGLFTHHILNGLNGKADANGDGLVDARELYSFVVNNVRADSEKQGEPQVPEFNPSYDRSIPLAYVNESGLQNYKKWFDTDPAISRNLAFFDEALKENHLTKPDRQSAWYYYNVLNLYPRTPTETVKTKKDELIAKFNLEAQAVIERSPIDPRLWEEASEWLDRAYELSRDKGLRAKQAYCSAMMRYHSGEQAAAEREHEVALKLVEEGQLKEPTICWRIGQFYKKSGSWDRARRGYKLAVSFEPKPEWLAEYGEVLLEANDLPEAELQLRRAYEIKPDYAQGLKLLATVLLRGEKPEKFAEALETATRARTLSPEDISIEEVYGWALSLSAEPARAIVPLRRVAMHHLNDEKQRDKALFLLSQAFAKSGDLARSIAALREAETRGTKDPALFEALGRLLEQKGDLAGAIAATEKAVSFSKTSGSEKAARIQKVGEYLERIGRFDDAAYRFRDAGRMMTDVKLGTVLELHARVLFHRAGRSQEAGPIAKRASGQANQIIALPTLLIIPGGREALEFLSGIRIEAGDESFALGQIFDACLRDSTLHTRLKFFHEKYPELARKVESKGVKIGGRLELPAADQPLSEATKEVLKFFGIKESSGRREINQKEFDARKSILQALGGDPERLARGEQTFIRLKNDEFSVPLRIDSWLTRLNDVDRAKPETYLLGFLKDSETMRLFVSFSALPDAAAQWLYGQALNKDNLNEVADCLYNTVYFLRFRQDGTLYFPGQQQGALNWQKALNAMSVSSAVPVLFKKDNGAVLYLLAALSNGNEVGDFIARSPLFEAFHRLVIKNESLPLAREPFDLIDLFPLFRVEGEKLRLPEPLELWLTEGKEKIDPIPVLLSRLGKVTAGREIPIVRQLVALDYLRRERPDWLGDLATMNLIAAQIGSRKEAQLELALDLDLNPQQLKNYLTRVARLEAISTPTTKTASIRAFQSAAELLRLRVKNAVVDQARAEALVNRFLEIDLGSEKFMYDLLLFVKNDLGGYSGADGADAEGRLLGALAERTPLAMPVQTSGANPSEAKGEASLHQFDNTKLNRERMLQALDMLKHTRFREVVDAWGALQTLEQNASDTAAIEKLKAAVGKFIIPDPPPPPKKNAKQPVVQPPSIKDLVQQLAGSVDAATLTEMRFQLMSFVSEALLGITYATMLNDSGDQESPYAGLVRAHELGATAWGDSDFEPGRKVIRGNIGRLASALAEMEANVSIKKDGKTTFSLRPDWGSLMLQATTMVDNRKTTNRALEFVARAIDLGEESLVLYAMGDPTAQTVINRLEDRLSYRRAYIARAGLDEANMQKAIKELSMSELYQIGVEYLKLRMTQTAVGELAKEPGGLGAIAAVLAANPVDGDRRGIPAALQKEINQYGLPVAGTAGLMRLELTAKDGYEQAYTFRDKQRGLERLQDFKLAIARACYRRGYSAQVALSPLVARAALENAFATAAGQTVPPERDWHDAITILQTVNETSLKALLDKLMASNFANAQPTVSWNEEGK